ncbi:hypothetical protein SAMN05660652_03599 [Propionivibrio dicarboxylicus]|uniref:Uncharacterized protein n=1 Tax=Propionivibrio dicarboxylicus TaxID=83767 RepID=A0A1G8LCB0_9RHOO|nr:hypothetical protein SAMN05660652_03599 [Propionivibrio dicarboxylicus]
MNAGWALFLCALCIWAGYIAGYRRANVDNADECRRLGGFYVGKSIFRCVEVAQLPDPRNPGASAPLDKPGR